MLALTKTAQDAVSTIDELIKLHDENSERVSEMSRASKNAMLVFHYLESNPIIEVKKKRLRRR